MDKFTKMLVDVASVIGSDQSGEIISFSGVDDNGILVLKQPEESYHVTCVNNFFEGDLKADVFRIALTIIAASELSIIAYENRDNAAFTPIGERANKLYQQVREVAFNTLTEADQAKMAEYLD